MARHVGVGFPSAGRRAATRHLLYGLSFMRDDDITRRHEELLLLYPTHVDAIGFATFLLILSFHSSANISSSSFDDFAARASSPSPTSYYAFSADSRESDFHDAII